MWGTRSRNTLLDQAGFIHTSPLSRYSGWSATAQDQEGANMHILCTLLTLACFSVVLVRFSLLCRDTMTIATLIKKTFNWGGLLIVSEVQSFINMVDCMESCRQMWCCS